MSAEIPGTPALICPQHMRGARVVPGIVEALPFPIGKIAGVDLEIADGSLRCYLDSISLSYDSATTSVLARGVVQGESVEAGFKIRDCGCIIPLILREKLPDSALQFTWRILEPGDN